MCPEKRQSGLLDLRKGFRSGRLAKADFISQAFSHHQRLFDHVDYLKGTDIASIELSDKGVCLTTREMGIKMVASGLDERLTPIDILNFGEAEEREISLFSRLLKKNCGQRFTMLDVGANIGWFSLNMAKRFPRARLISFEPIPATYEKLLANLKLNGVRNVKPAQAGVSDRAGRAVFYCDSKLCANASLAERSRGATVGKVRVKLIKLDDHCKEHSIKPNAIKVDVEGAELFVFQGARQVLAKYHPIIYTEMLRKWSADFGYHPDRIIELLRGLGYECFALRGSRLRPMKQMTDRTRETNFVFINRRYHRI